MASTITTTTITATGLVEPRRFTAAEYHRMVEAGILDEDDHTELIEGEIVVMSAMGRRHRILVNRLTERLVLALHGRGIVQIQSSTPLTDDTEPEPDIVVYRWREDFYASEDARPEEDIFLIMEVADSSLAYDRTVKSRIYAATGIPEYWLWDVNGRAALVYRRPGPSGYEEMTTHRGNEGVSPAAFPDLVLVPDEIIP